MKPNLSKIRVISFSRKTTVFSYQYRLGKSFIVRPWLYQGSGSAYWFKTPFSSTRKFFIFTYYEIIRVNSYNHIFLFHPRQSSDAVYCYSLIQIAVRFCCLEYFEDLLALRPTPNLEDHPLSAVRDCLFNIFAAALHNWKAFPPTATWGRAMPWWQGTHLTWLPTTWKP
jgi:hypothetical protein